MPIDIRLTAANKNFFIIFTPSLEMTSLKKMTAGNAVTKAVC